MKKLKKLALVLTSALLVMVMALGLVACSKSESIKKAFEDEGYTVTTVNKDSNELTKAIYAQADEDDKKDLENSELIFVQSGLKIGLIVKFSSTSELKDYLDDDYDEAVDAGLVNGDCYLFTLTPTSAVAEIFKNA